MKEAGNRFYVQKKYKRAIECYTRAIQLKGDEAAFYSNRAAAYGQQHQYDKALQDCNKAVEIDPTFMRGYTRKANFQLTLGRTDEAKDTCSKMTIRDPRSREALDILKKVRTVERGISLGQKLLDQRKFSESYSTVQHGLSIAPRSVSLQVLQLKGLRGKGLLDQAIKVSTTMIRNGIRNNDVLTERAHIFYQQTNFESAKKHLVEVLKADPDHKASQSLLKRLRNLTKTQERGNNAFKSGKIDEAIQVYTECLKFDPQLKLFNSQLYCNRGAAKIKKRDWKGACQDLTYAIHLDATYLKAYQRRSMCYEEMGELQKALSDLQTARTVLTQKKQSTESMDRKIQQLNVRLKRANRKDYYKILGVSTSFTEKELTKAKRKKALKWHPDKWASKGKDAQDRANTIMKDVNEAFAVLSDPQKRRRYDAGEDDLDGPSRGRGLYLMIQGNKFA
jgi:DnaJ family protein C protein 7